MGTEIHRTIASVAAAWDALADEVEAAPFMRPGWFTAWHEAFAGTGLTIVALRRNGHLAAVIPLIERRGAVRSATNDHSPMFDILATGEAAAHDLATAVFERRPRSAILQLVDPDGASVRGWLSGALVRATRPGPKPFSVRPSSTPPADGRSMRAGWGRG